MAETLLKNFEAKRGPKISQGLAFIESGRKD